LIRFGQKSKSCIPKYIRSPTAMLEHFRGIVSIAVMIVFLAMISLRVISAKMIIAEFKFISLCKFY